VAADADLPIWWESKDLSMLEDDALKMLVEEEKNNIESLYEQAFDISINFKHLINPDKFTLENYQRAYSLVVTRVFGWSLPYMMLVPFADNANHFCVENYFELFNSRLARKALRKNQTFDNFEKCYFTRTKAKFNFLKHFKEDDQPEKENQNSN
jgi:hypothetical protein